MTTDPDRGVRATGVTVAICTLDRRSDLMRTLDGLLRQDCPVPWEIVVVDNGGADGSGEATRDRARAAPAPLRYLREERRGVSLARNRALLEAAGELLVFIDDDMDAPPSWLASHVKAFEDPGVVVTGGRILPVLPDSTPEWLRREFLLGTGGPGGRYDLGETGFEIEPGRHQLPFTGNLGLRRAAALRIGGFRTDLGWTPQGRRIGGEDIDLVRRMLEAGGRCRYLPDACLQHRVQPERCTPEYFRVWNLGAGRASVLMRKPRGPAVRSLLALGQVGRIVRYALPTAWIGSSKGTRVRKRQQAWGRILQLASRKPR